MPRQIICYIFGLDDLGGAALISGGLSAIGSIGGGLIGQAGQSNANAQMMEFNAQQAQLNRDFQERMSSTAYQRAMQDMQAAGLNPILAANLGGASTPGGGQGSVTLGNPGASMQQGVTAMGNALGHSAQVKATLTQAEKDTSQSDLNKATTGLTHEATSKTNQDTRTSSATEDAQRASAEASRASAAVSAAQKGLITQQTNSAASQARIDAAAAGDVETYGVPRNESIGGVISRVLRKVAPDLVSGAAKSLPTTAVGTKAESGWLAGPDSPVVQERIRRNRGQ